MKIGRIAALTILLAGPVGAAAPGAEVRDVFERFVAAQNAHDLKAVGDLLLDSPSFLWITKGAAIWGRADALTRFETLYQGTWRLDPDMSAFRIVFADDHVAQILVPIDFSIGAKDQPVRPSRFLMNQVLTKTGGSWRIASILPIPAPPPAP